MMTKLFALVGILLACSLNASADGGAVFSKGYSTWTVAGVTCNTATASDITASLPAFNIGAYRIMNQDSTNAVWIGQSSLVSTDTTKAALGEKLTAGSNGVWEIGKNPDLAQVAVKIWCKAADVAGSAGVRLSLAIFGYK